MFEQSTTETSTQEQSTQDNFESTYDSYFDKGEHEKIETKGESQEETEEHESPVEIDDESQDEEPEISEEDDNEVNDDYEEEADPKQKKIDNNLKAALKEERIKRQESDKKIKESDDKLQQMQAQLQQMTEAMNALFQPQQQEQLPNYEEDPLGFLKAQQDQIARALQQQAQTTQQQTEQTKAYQYAVSLNNEYNRARDEAIKTNPDYENAAKYLENAITSEYKIMGYDDNTIRQYLIEDKINLIQTAKNQGKNPTDMAWEMAKAKGYQPKQKETSKLNTIKEGIKKSKSLGSSGGQSTQRGVNTDDISTMNDREFEAMWEKMKHGELQIN